MLRNTGPDNQQLQRPQVLDTVTYQTERPALVRQQKLDRLVLQRRQQQGKNWQVQLDALTEQRQRVAAMLGEHLERNKKLNERLVASSHPNEVAKEVDKVVVANAQLHAEFKKLVASSNLIAEVDKEFVANSHLIKELNGEPIAPTPRDEAVEKEAVEEEGAAMEIEAAAAVNGGDDSDGGSYAAAVGVEDSSADVHEAEGDGDDGWWDTAAAAVDSVAAAQGAESDGDDEGWYAVHAEEAFFELGGRSVLDLLAH